jgi:hypothetical protein
MINHTCNCKIDSCLLCCLMSTLLDISTVLTQKQEKELHDAILDYMTTKGFVQSAAAFQSEAQVKRLLTLVTALCPLRDRQPLAYTLSNTASVDTWSVVRNE